MRRLIKHYRVFAVLALSLAAICLHGYPRVIAPPGKRRSAAMPLGDPKIRVVRMAGDNNFPPFEFVSPSGEYKGFNVDIMRAVALELGLDLELIPMPWATVKDALDSGAVDAVQGMKYSAERDRYFDFTRPYFRSTQAIFVRSDNVSISGLDSLTGCSVAVQEGDYGHEVVRGIPGAEPVVFENQESALDALISKSVDAFVGNRYVGHYFAQKKRKTADLKIVGSPIDPTDYAVAVREGNRELVDLLNKGLEAIKKDRTYDKIYEKWFGEEIQPPAAMLKRSFIFLQIVLVAAAAIGLFVLRWNTVLRREVAARTVALARSDALKDQILNSSSAGIVAISSGGRVITANARALELMGANRDRVEGRQWEDSPVADLFDRELVRRGITGAASARNAETRVTRDGKEMVLGYHIDPLHGMDGRERAPRRVRGSAPREGGLRVGVLLTFDDVTENRNLQEALARRDRMEALGKLVAGMAHEIRNPFTSIKAFLEILPQKYDNPSYRAEVLRHVPAEIDRLDGIISEILEYSRPRPPLEESLDVPSLIGDTLALFGPRLNRAGISVETGIAPSLRVRADKGQMKQILINMILNAVEALEGGGSLRILAREENGMAFIRVIDDGPGISEGDLPHVFDPFFTTKEKGSGLGLWIAYELTRENGGDIKIRSVEGLGTEVSLTLRLAGG